MVKQKQKQPNRNRSSRRRKPKTDPVLLKLWFGLMAVVFAIACLAAYTSHQRQRNIAAIPEKEAADDESKPRFEKNQDYDAFRRSVIQRDRELLDKRRQKKAARRANSQQDNSVEYYRDRLADLELQLQADLVKKSMDQERSLGWGIKQQIEKLKQDPPPE